MAGNSVVEQHVLMSWAGADIVNDEGDAGAIGPVGDNSNMWQTSTIS